MNKDKIKGLVKEAQGKAKEVTGKIFNDKTLEEKGKVQATIGKAQINTAISKMTLRKVADIISLRRINHG